MDHPPTPIEFQRPEGTVRVTFTPGLTIDQWAQTIALRRPLSREEFEKAAQQLAADWNVNVSFETLERE
jgi:hypothetical protein